MLSRINKLVILAVVAIANCLTASAQDPQLSQFYAAPIYTNPAFVGSTKKIRFTASGRNQYSSLNNNYLTSVAAIDAYIRPLHGGIGVMALADRAGDGQLTRISLSGIYSYNLNINREWAVNAAIQGSYFQQGYDFNRLIFPDMIDDIKGVSNPTNEPNRNENKSFMNFGTGIMAYNANFYGGMAVHNLLEPNQSFFNPNGDAAELKLPRRFTVHAGINVDLIKSRNEANRVFVSPNILFMQQRNFYQMNLGFYLKRQNITVGGWFRQTSRNTDALIFLLGLRLPSFRIGYSYDFTVSDARTATGGSHELSIGFEIKTRVRNNMNRFGKPIKCPEF